MFVTKKPCISAKEPCDSIKEPHISTAEPYVSEKSPMYSHTSPESPKTKPLYLHAKESYVSAKEPYKSKRALISMKCILFFYHHEPCVPIYSFFCLFCVCLSFWRLIACGASTQNTHESCNWLIDFIMISLCVIHLCIVFMYCILILDSVWSEWAKHPYIYKRALLFTNLYIHLFILLSCDIHVRPCINLFCVFQSCIPFWVPTACGASGQSTREASPTSSQKSPLCLQKSPISPQRALYLFISFSLGNTRGFWGVWAQDLLNFLVVEEYSFSIERLDFPRIVILTCDLNICKALLFLRRTFPASNSKCYKSLSSFRIFECIPRVQKCGL